MTPRDFITALTPAAQASQAHSGVPASVTIAQAALESAWGESGLARQGKNLFGIKATDSWAGDTIAMPTKEVVDGQVITVTARFRAYPDWQGSIDDHATFLRENRRYAKAFDALDGEGFARAIAQAGYATDPAYADKLINLIHAHNLLDLDMGQPVAVPVGEATTPPPAPPNPAADWPFEGGEGRPPRAPHAPETPMLPALIPVIASAAAELIPEVGKLIFDKSKTVPERNVEIAGKVLRTVVDATGAANAQDAVEKIRADPAALEAARLAIRQNYYTLQEAVPGGGISEAREAMVKATSGLSDLWRGVGYGVVIGTLSLLIVGGGGLMVWNLLMSDSTSGEQKGLLIGALIATISAVVAFWFGSAASSRTKDQTIERLSK